MNTNFVLPGSVDLFAIAALMHSSLMTWIFEGYFGALRMGGGYMQAQAPQLRVLPIPDLPAEPDAGSDYGALARLGRQWGEVHSAIHERELVFVGDLLEAFGVRDRRNDDPAFTLPRQPKLIAEVKDPSRFGLRRVLESGAGDGGAARCESVSRSRAGAAVAGWPKRPGAT